MLWSIDSNASLALIADRLGRSVGAVRQKLRVLGYAAESLGGYKVKDIAEMLAVSPGRVRYWVAEKLLLTKGGRITESSLAKFLADHPKKVPFELLTRDMQNWLREMGYPEESSQREAKTCSG
ncbi:MAG: helix-turn-helix domain-containing protein [Bryobacterales bacterium]|nr:helix-turn-helix domain-containing protein [Bryobacterales bacterium]